MHTRAFTLIELLTVLAALAVLAGLMAPGFQSATEAARLAACQANLHALGVAISSYAAGHNRRLPPFAFSGYQGCLPESGHWGGPERGYHDPTMLGRVGVGEGPVRLNLWALVHERMVETAALICPAAPRPVRESGASYFPYTKQFSTYCLRFPVSERVFAGCPGVARWHGQGLLRAYEWGLGGRRLPGGEVVPQVRIDLEYPFPDDLDGGQWGWDPYQVATDAVLADTFWWQRREEPAGEGPDPPTNRIQAGWCHGRRFNVLYGQGSVHCVEDDGTVAANTIEPGGSLPDDGWYWTTYAEQVWQLFDRPLE